LFKALDRPYSRASGERVLKLQLRAQLRHASQQCRGFPHRVHESRGCPGVSLAMSLAWWLRSFFASRVKRGLLTARTEEAVAA